MMNRKKLAQIIEPMSGMLYRAHELIEAYIEGKPVDFNALENYFDSAHALLQETDRQGCLIGPSLDELADIDWLDPKATLTAQ